MPSPGLTLFWPSNGMPLRVRLSVGLEAHVHAQQHS
jgi:hypothetical protein